MNECAQWKNLFTLYEEGEASPIGRHIRECPLCRKQASKYAPELLFALLADQWRDVSLYCEERPKVYFRTFQSALRLAASILIVMALGIGGYLIYDETQKEFLLPISQEAGAMREDLRARYPLVKEVPKGTQYYVSELPDGARLVYFYVEDL